MARGVKSARAAVAVPLVLVLAALSCSAPGRLQGVAGQDVTMLYAADGVVLVAETATPESTPDQLFLSDDGAHWRNITPPTSRAPVRGDGYLVFEQASFVNSDLGWVVGCAEASDIQVIYETTDRGDHWQQHSGPGCDLHGTTHVQLLDSDFAIADNTVCPGVGCVPLETSTNGGRSWIPVAATGDGKTMEIGGRTYPDPDGTWPREDPIRFVTTDLTFAADGIGSPYGAFGYVAPYGYFVRSVDGGRTWKSVAPPVPGGTSGDHVRFDLPIFSSPTTGVVAVLDHSLAGNQLGFDTTRTAGQTWTLSTEVPVARLGGFDNAYPGWLTPTYSVANPSTWWVANPSQPVSIEITTNAGRNWSTVSASGLPAAPAQILALDDHRALATIPDQNATTGINDHLYQSSDSGRTWSPLKP